MLAEEDRGMDVRVVAKRAISQFCKRYDTRCTSVLTSLMTFVLQISIREKYAICVIYRKFYSEYFVS